MRGKFIVFEGIDGAGTETQSKKLLHYLRSKGTPTLFITYPDYGPSKTKPTKPIAKLICEWLYKKYRFDEKVQFLLYSTDMVKDIEKIEKALEKGKVVIADRYFTSTIAYQGVKGFPIQTALKYAELFHLIKPDLIIFLDISPETSLKRKYKEKRGKLDRHEKDRVFLSSLAEFYRKLARKNIFGKWVCINGENSIQEVFEKVKEVVSRELNE